MARELGVRRLLDIEAALRELEMLPRTAIGLEGLLGAVEHRVVPRGLRARG